ncbi:MAG TPA: hypothetical protein VF662_07115 [Allosphingosinicella sp.]|jgi:hypothetical protein
MTDPMPCPEAAAKRLAKVETISDYYRRRADEERQCADRAIDQDLRRIHLQRAASMNQLAEDSRLKA